MSLLVTWTSLLHTPPPASQHAVRAVPVTAGEMSLAHSTLPTTFVASGIGAMRLSVVCRWAGGR